MGDRDIAIDLLWYLLGAAIIGWLLIAIWGLDLPPMTQPEARP